MGYGAPGLGCILIQNTKAEPAREHINPLAMISVVIGEGLTVAQLEQGFTEQFKWNWNWKAKAMPNGTFQMRFPNKMRFEELSSFDHFSVKGTNVQINVKEWTQESEAIGKMHIVWVRVTGIPDEMKGYLALFEVGSNLGPVMAVDMASLRAHNRVRIKVGMMELEPLPMKLILTTPKGLLFQACFNLEEVVEHGWFREQLFDEGKESDLIPTKVGQREGKQHDGSKDGQSPYCSKSSQEFVGGSSARQAPVEAMIPDKVSQVLRDRELAVQMQEEEMLKDLPSKGVPLMENKKQSEVMLSSNMLVDLGGTKYDKTQDNGDKGKESCVELLEESDMGHLEEEGERVHLGDSEELIDSQELDDNFATKVGGGIS